MCNQCDNLSAREASLVEHIASLEKQLQQSLNRKPSPPPFTPTVLTPQQNLELQQLQQQLESVTADRKQLEEQLSSQVCSNFILTQGLYLFLVIAV